MKQYITTLLIFLSLAAGAQSYQPLTNPGMTGLIRGPIVIQGNMWINTDTLPVPVSLQNIPALATKNDVLYRWSTTTHHWVAAGGESTAWGNIPGILSAQTDLQNALNLKQNKLTPGTTAQYYDGTLALRNFATGVNSSIDTFYVTTRARLKKVVDSINGGLLEHDPFRSVSASVVQASPYSKLLTINRADGTSFTASWGDTSLNTLRDSIGWIAVGPYLRGKPAQHVGDRDSAEVVESALRTLIESYITDGTFVTSPDVTLDSVVFTGTGWKTAHFYYASGRVDTAGFFDRTGPAGLGETYTASNGDTLLGNDIQLGGSLSHNVRITTHGNEYRIQTAPELDGTTGVEFILSTTGKIWNEAWDYVDPAFKHDIWTQVEADGVQLYADNFGSAGANALGSSEVNVRPEGLILKGAGNRVQIGEAAGDLPSYADNAAAIAGGLPVGALYQSGDFVKRVH
jgi:hypothetical protein